MCFLPQSRRQHPHAGMLCAATIGRLQRFDAGQLKECDWWMAMASPSLPPTALPKKAGMCWYIGKGAIWKLLIKSLLKPHAKMGMMEGNAEPAVQRDRATAPGHSVSSIIEKTLSFVQERKKNTPSTLDHLNATLSCLCSGLGMRWTMLWGYVL